MLGSASTAVRRLPTRSAATIPRRCWRTAPCLTPPRCPRASEKASGQGSGHNKIHHGGPVFAPLSHVSGAGVPRQSLPRRRASQPITHFSSVTEGVRAPLASTQRGLESTEEKSMKTLRTVGLAVMVFAGMALAQTPGSAPATQTPGQTQAQLGTTPSQTPGAPAQMNPGAAPATTSPNNPPSTTTPGQAQPNQTTPSSNPAAPATGTTTPAGQNPPNANPSNNPNMPKTASPLGLLALLGLGSLGLGLTLRRKREAES